MRYFIVLLLLLSLNSFADYKESDYQSVHCSLEGGQTEHILPDRTRIDCMTDTTVIEYDFSYKWAECISQALHYAMSTNKQAVCVLILKNQTETEYKHVSRAKSLVDYYNLPIIIDTFNM